MYFDFEDYRPDITPVGRAISWREGVLISVMLHLLLLGVVLAWPSLFPYDPSAVQQVTLARPERPDDEPPARFVFVQPRIDTPAPKPPPRAEASDRDRMARARERAETPSNPLPFSRGNSTERIERPAEELARGRGPEPEPSDGQNGEDPPSRSELKVPETQSALQIPQATPSERAPGLGRGLTPPGGALGDALRNLQRYIENEQFHNPQGGGGSFGPAIQFDTKGVEFGPWIRRFVAQVKRNWLIPIAAMSMSGRVVITFNVHKNGFITDLTVVGPSPVDAFNNAAYGALAASNPTAPLPLEYPADKAFFTVTFFYNEQPPR
jgi:TonB family protein